MTMDPATVRRMPMTCWTEARSPSRGTAKTMMATGVMVLMMEAMDEADMLTPTICNAMEPQ